MSEIPLVDPELENVLHQFATEISARLGPEVTMERKLALLDVLAVVCVFNADTKELNITVCLAPE